MMPATSIPSGVLSTHSNTKMIWNRPSRREARYRRPRLEKMENLDLTQPTVDGNLRACHKGRVRRSQKCHCAGDLFWLAEALHRHLAKNAFRECVHFLRGEPTALESRGSINWPGADSVDTDTARYQFCCDRTRERAQRGLGGGVHGSVHHAFFVDHGSVQNNRGAIVKKWKRFLNREVCAFGVNVEQFVKQALGSGSQRHEFINPGVDEEYVNLAQFFGNRGIEPVQVRAFRDVGFDRKNAVADACFRISQSFRISSRNCNLRALFLKPFRGRQADSAVSSGNHRNLTFEPFHDELSSAQSIEFSAMKPCEFHCCAI